MKVRLTPLRMRLALLFILGCLPALAFVQGGEKEPAKKAAWTSEEALAQLRDYPRDPYLQYVAMQMARREKAGDGVYQQIEQMIAADGRREQRQGRLNSVDLFSVFTGALAVQESLQLDTMRGPNRNQAVPQDQELREKRKKEIVDIAKMSGPATKSHPWEKMLGDKKPNIEPLAKMVPDDYFLVEFRSVTKLLDLTESGDLWTMHLSHQANKDARSQQIGERIRKQLVIETNRLLRPVYDSVVEDVALTGSDLFFGEGSDVTMIFRLKQPELFRPRMDDFIVKAARERKDAKKTEGEYLGVKYDHLTTPERDLHVFSAYPEANVHVRSNSKAAFFRVLAAIKGKTPDGKAVTRLGDTTEFAYIRTLMPLTPTSLPKLGERGRGEGAKEEDGFIYLSDSFIRHMVGPQLKLNERRRMLCYNHLRMIGHATLLYRTEHGKAPASLDELVKADCCPGAFNDGDLRCFDGGKYTLSADGSQGVCSHHGHAQHLVPCCENPLVWVTGLEADEYKQFLDEYSRYWVRFFDPIALRIQVTPECYRLETIVLPLINNSIYQGMALALGGKPEPLDALPVPKRNIFSIQGRFNKEALLKQDAFKDAVAGEKEMRLQLARDLGIPEKDAEALDLVKFVTQGLGNQVGLHIYDAPPMFDLNTPELLGLLLGTFNGNNHVGLEEVWISFLVASLNSPVYLALPVQDEKIVDEFLNQLDKVLPPLARQRENLGFIRFEQDFYKTKLKNKEETPMRCYSFSIGPVKWRMFWARIGGALYIASKPFILEDFVALNAERANAKDKPAPDPEATAHALLRLRPKNWNQVLEDYKLGWAENNRQACTNNLGPLSSVGRAVANDQSGEQLGKEAHRLADQLYAVHFFCPESGKYVLSPDGKTCSCSVHGSAHEPRQNVAPNEAAGPNKVLQQFGGLTASLTFLEDGLHAVIVVERK
jgi:hypothetical protein